MRGLGAWGGWEGLAFGGWGVSNLVFQNVRAARTHCGGLAGRGPPSSGALVFAGGTEANTPSSGLQLLNGSYANLCRPNLVWPRSAFATVELAEAPFTPRSPLRLQFCFDQV